jgi:hypothetical protein
MTPLGEITQPTCRFLTHMLPAYWRKLLVRKLRKFIAPSFSGPKKKDVAGYRNGNGAWESSPKGKEQTSKDT